ncbi:tape measure protein [Sporosarcina sp. resist]|uniref:tape measure protein n=1 Tax=Sporosarcina sp. resist TaxID=2762563 RepID=UPI00164E1D9B|nr:tape measure protein [Sporosarcina sp. resist]QNK89443.1 tape measure protein [Sporosarcina sp. resist]
MGAQTSLSLADRMSGPLIKMMKAMDSTIRVMEKMDNAANNIDTTGLAKARSSIESASADMQRLISTSSNATAAAASVTRGLSGMGGDTSGLAVMNAALWGTTGAIETLNSMVITPPKIRSISGSDITNQISKVADSALVASEAFNTLNASITSSGSSANFGPDISALSTMSSTADGAAKSLVAFGSASTTAASGVVDVLSQTSQLSSTMDQAAGATDNLSSAGDDLSGSTNGLAVEQEDLNGRIIDGTSNLQEYVVAVLAAVGAYKAFSAAKTFIQDIFSKGIEFHAFKQASEVAFTTFLGDAKIAKQYMADMLTFAQTTPFAYPDLLESSRNLIAFGVEAKNTFPIMQAIGDATAAIGGGAQEMMEMADVFGQIQAQGKLTAMEVNRLGSKGINAIQMLADASGVTADAMKKQISSGAVGAGEAISVLVEGMNKKFGGLMAGVKGTWAGSIDSMKSASRNAGVAMMEDFMVLDGPLVNLVNNFTGVLKKLPQYVGPAVAAFLPLIAMINEAFSEGRFDAFFAGLGAGLTTTANIAAGLAMSMVWILTEISALGSMIADNWNTIGPVITIAATALGTYLFLLVAFRTAALLAAGANAILTFQTAAAGAAAMFAAGSTIAQTVAQHGLNAAIYAFPGTWILLAFVAVIALVIFAMVQWAEQSAAVFGAIVGGIYWLGAAFHNVIMGIANFFIMAVEWIMNTWNQGMYNIQMAWMAFNLMVRIVLDAIGNAVLKTVEWIMNTWNDGLFGVQTAFHKMASFVLTIMSGVASGVVGTVNTALGAISDLINGAVNGINSFIGLLNGVLGTDLSTVGTVDLKMGNGVSKFIDNMKSDLSAPVRAEKANLGRMDTAGDYAKNIEMPSAPAKKSFERMEYTSLGDAFDRGNAAGASMSMAASDKLTGAIEKVTGLVKGNKDGKDGPPSASDFPLGDLAGMNDPLGGGADKLAKKKNPTGGKLDKVGKIEKDINIADEDIKMLRDLAEIKSIQQTITLTPQVSFGDMTIREDADIPKIIRAIEKYVRDEMSRSAEGVYT